VIVESCRQCLPLVVFGGQTAECDDNGPRHAGPQSPGDFVSIDARHPNVEQDKIRAMMCRLIADRFTIIYRPGFMSEQA
jgi:hypothetical protein